jgi:hypothetical protein
MKIEKTISGGQTGVDRGALDAALAAHFPCGGWCPENRLAEDGPIPDVYPLTPLPGAGFRARTRQNVVDSDGTVILFDGRLTGGELSGGSLLTQRTAARRGKPLLVIDASKLSSDTATEMIITWENHHHIAVLNVAGPRASGWAQGYVYARSVIAKILLEAGTELRG